MRSGLLKAVAWVVGLRAVITVLHALAHQSLAIPATTLDWSFRVLVISLAPLLALTLLFTTRAAKWGTWLLIVSLFASLVYGLLYHFVLPSDDNALTMPASSWQPVFVATAYLLLLLEAAGTILTAQLLRTVNQVKTAKV